MMDELIKLLSNLDSETYVEVRNFTHLLQITVCRDTNDCVCRDGVAIPKTKLRKNPDMLISELKDLLQSSTNTKQRLFALHAIRLWALYGMMNRKYQAWAKRC